MPGKTGSWEQDWIFLKIEPPRRRFKICNIHGANLLALTLSKRSASSANPGLRTCRH